MDKSTPNALRTVSLQRRSWLLGAVDAFNGRQAQTAVEDPLAYASGRVEGQAWREQGLDLADMLKENRLPYPAPGS